MFNKDDIVIRVSNSVRSELTGKSIRIGDIFEVEYYINEFRLKLKGLEFELFSSNFEILK